MRSPARSTSHSRSQSNNAASEDCALNLDTKSSRVEPLSCEENSATSKDIVVADSPHSEDRYRSSVEPADEKQTGPPAVSSDKIGSPTPVSPHAEMPYFKWSFSEAVSDFSAHKYNSIITKGNANIKFDHMHKMDYSAFPGPLSLTSPSPIELPMARPFVYQPPYIGEHLPLYLLQHPSLFPIDSHRKGVLTDSFTPSRSSSSERPIYPSRLLPGLSGQSTIAAATH